jgi:cytochrome subunit of sulfide dehydrogenase
MNISWARACALLTTALLASPFASAQSAASPPPGRLLASNCFQCHGTNGKGRAVDSLAGKSADKLFKEMKEQQSGEEGDTIMARHAMGFSDAQLRELARWLATQR